MKDLYSFHTDIKDLEKYYFKVVDAYKKIFKRCGLKPVVVEASGGTIGGKITHEFMVPAESGEDKILICQSCGWGVNTEIASKKRSCPKCKKSLKELAAIETAHTFNLETSYSQKMGAYFRTKNEKKEPIVMGCYGIGLSRLMATVIEVNHDNKGMVWPEEIAPFKIHLLSIGEGAEIRKVADKIYKDLSTFPQGCGGQAKNIDVLYDDRAESAGVKFADADLIGIPWRVVVSEKTLAKDSVEIKRRSERKTRLVKIKDLIKQLTIDN